MRRISGVKFDVVGIKLTMGMISVDLDGTLTVPSADALRMEALSEDTKATAVTSFE